MDVIYHMEAPPRTWALHYRLYRVTKVLGDTYFVDLKMRFVPRGQTGGDFIY